MAKKQDKAMASLGGNSSIALLIDGENISHEKHPAIIRELAKRGRIVIRRCYADWTAANMKGWKEKLQLHAIQPIQQFAYTKGKNSTDGALIIDAMDILYQDRIDCFCIASNDSDYTRLAMRLRESGPTVIGIGAEHTPESFRNACDEFILLENLLQPGISPERTEKGRDIPAHIREFVIASIQDLQEGPDQYILGSELGLSLQRQKSDWSHKTYGYTKQADFLRAIDELDVNEVGDVRIKSKEEKPK